MAAVFSRATVCSFHACCLCLDCVLGLLLRASTSCLCATLRGADCSAEVTRRGSWVCAGELTECQCCSLPLVTRFFAQLGVWPLLQIFWSAQDRAVCRWSQAQVQRQLVLRWVLWVWAAQSVFRWAGPCWEVKWGQICSGVLTILFWRNFRAELRKGRRRVSAAFSWSEGGKVKS